MARPRTRFLSVLLISAAAGICTWLALPSSPVDRAFMEVVARSSANPPFIISGKGSHTEPWALQVISPHSKAASRNAPLIISLADDPDHIFQESPPSPVDLAIILKNIRRLGASRAAISAILAWEKPDVIALSALDSQLAAFSAIATAAPLSRSPNTTALPPSFRRASLPLDQIRGDTSVLPAVNRISLPDIILGGDSAISGFSILEQDDNDNTPLIARWDERAVFAFPLVAVMAQRGLSFDGVEIELGKFIRFPHGGPIIPIDEFGRLSATLGKASARDTVRADALIDGDAAFPPDSFALLRDDQSAAEAGTRAFSRKVDPLIEAISAGAGMAAVREFRRMSATAECIILLGIATLLAGFTPLDRFSRQLAFGISAAVLLIIHFVAASTASVWLPTLPAIAAVFSAFIISRFFTGKAAIPVIEIPPPAVVPAKQAEPIAVFTIAREVSKPKPASKKTAREAAPKIPAAKKTTAKKSTAAKKTAAKKTPAAKKAARSRKSPPESPP